MATSIKKVAVIGSGVMGAGIAAHVAEERRLWTQVLRDRGVSLD